MLLADKPRQLDFYMGYHDNAFFEKRFARTIDGYTHHFSGFSHLLLLYHCGARFSVRNEAVLFVKASEQLPEHRKRVILRGSCSILLSFVIDMTMERASLSRRRYSRAWVQEGVSSYFAAKSTNFSTSQ